MYLRTRLNCLMFLCGILTTLGTLATAQVFNTVHAFSPSGGAVYPLYVTPAQGRDGKLYGATSGYAPICGTVFRQGLDGSGGIVFEWAGTNCASSGASLTLATDGNFYGTAVPTGGLGILFRIAPSGAYTVLHEFSGSDGAFPISPPIEASDGNLYGTTYGYSGFYATTIYKYTRSGVFSVIYLPNAPNGGAAGPLIQATDGNLYGTTESGGTGNCGTIFKINKSGTLLHDYSFGCNSGGASPIGPLMQADDGDIYGVTFLGGDSHSDGLVYRLDQKGVFSVVHTLQGSPSEGANSTAALVQATDGNLYGVARAGGLYGAGALFQLTKTGDYTNLYSMLGNSGELPQAALLQDTNGAFYGTAEFAGQYGYGTIYSLDMGLGPFVTFIRPNGKVGQNTQILGQGLTGTLGVSFNGIGACCFSVVSDTYMTAVVPIGATTGRVIVTTPTGELTSNKDFRIVGATNSVAKTKAAPTTSVAAK